MYLLEPNLSPAANFINSPLWADIKRCLAEREPEAPVSNDPIHTAAAKGFERKGFELAIAEIEKLPFEKPTTRTDPFARPAVTAIED